MRPGFTWIILIYYGTGFRLEITPCPPHDKYMKIVALVPMRHHSQRVPGKNYRPLAGKPLFQHIIETLLAVPEIQEIVVDTDSEPVMQGLRGHFPQVRIIDR